MKRKRLKAQLVNQLIQNGILSALDDKVNKGNRIAGIAHATLKYLDENTWNDICYQLAKAIVEYLDNMEEDET